MHAYDLEFTNLFGINVHFCIVDISEYVVWVNDSVCLSSL